MSDPTYNMPMHEFPIPDGTIFQITNANNIVKANTAAELELNATSSVHWKQVKFNSVGDISVFVLGAEVNNDKFLCQIGATAQYGPDPTVCILSYDATDQTYSIMAQNTGDFLTAMDDNSVAFTPAEGNTPTNKQKWIFKKQNSGVPAELRRGPK